MEHRIVKRLEGEIGEVIKGVVARHLKPPRLPLLPSHRTIHMMAKAAVSVYEAVAESFTNDEATD